MIIMVKSLRRRRGKNTYARLQSLEPMKEKLIKRFEDEVNALERELHMELPKEIPARARAGDLRENAEYQAPRSARPTSTPASPC
jgi:hypothetical protein